jgi:hypothetical protein
VSLNLDRIQSTAEGQTEHALNHPREDSGLTALERTDSGHCCSSLVIPAQRHAAEPLHKIESCLSNLTISSSGGFGVIPARKGDRPTGGALNSSPVEKPVEPGTQFFQETSMRGLSRPLIQPNIFHDAARHGDALIANIDLRASNQFRNIGRTLAAKGTRQSSSS